MDKILIFGTYEFLGFHLCKGILETGVEVEGIHLPFKEKGLFIEEKNMEIGRNANFTETSFEKWQREEIVNKDTVIVLDYYDFFMRKLEEAFLSTIKSISLDSYKKIVVLLPITIYAESHFSHMRKKLEECLLNVQRVQRIYLPTIYGPWQSEMFSFHQRLYDETANVKIDEREWQGDAIDVETVVESIIDLLNSPYEEVVVLSKDKNGWEKCAEILSLPYEKKDYLWDHSIHEYVLVNDKEVEVVLRNQKRYIQSRRE